jgi:molybdopterin-biosynthesis enzyme MoeA-like protein
MALVPEGASLIRNPVTDAPGFQIGNVFVMAGVPAIMQAMLEDVSGRLRTGHVVHARTLRVSGVGEGAVAATLEAAARGARHLSFGSYPFGAGTTGEIGTQLVIRGRDGASVDAAAASLLDELAGAGIAVEAL